VPTLPAAMVTVLAALTPPCSGRVWGHARALPAEAIRPAAWYRKARPTFADALALVRRELRRHQAFRTSPCACEMIKVPRAVVDRLPETLCCAA
jgi:hypothetical protein